ncbi:Glutathione S-transferase family protein [Perilla frutescens var. frutescens]|nr:Glutathione S-transferase family protein [Perilla frutescens var. frutescens]
MEVRVLGSWQSPFAMRVRIALNVKSVAYDFQQEDVLVAKSDLLLQSNPVHKKIPVLIHHNKPISESLIIVHYTDEVWASGPAILPSDPYDRAIARFWGSYIDETWLPLTAIFLREGEDAKKSYEETSKRLLLLEEAFTKCSGGENFFGGERIGYVDIALGSYLPWITVIDKLCNINLIDESKTPNLFKWAQHFSADAAVKDLLPHTDKLCDFAKFLASVIKPK